MSEPILRILIAEDHTIVRKGLISLLSTPRFHLEIVGEAADGAEAVELAPRLQPDVVLMDLVMPRMGGIEATAEILRDNEGIHILILTSFSGIERASEAIRAGARGFMLKDSSPDDLVYAIRSIARGQTVLPADVTTALLSGEAQDFPPSPASSADDLTERELTILARLAKGMSNKEIARELHISPHTVRSHVRTLFEKIGVSNRTQAALYAIENNLLHE